MELKAQAIEKFRSRRAVVALIGLGYAGLPLACCFAEAGFRTIGLDIDGQKIKALRRGESYISHIPGERLAAIVRTGKFQPTLDFDVLTRCDGVVICVPTPLAKGRTPDLTFITETAETVRRGLHPGILVALESTTYPGTTDEVLAGIFSESGFAAGDDYFLAFSPEREDPANNHFDTHTIPKIVGGVTGNCLEVACAAYGQVVERLVPVSSARVAEAAKLLENIFRCVNIAMVNELKLLFGRMSINVWEVIEAAATKPFGFMPFYPGPGLGGHCIPIDPFYLAWKARECDFPARFIELAGEINSAMPEHVVNQLAEGLNRQGKALKDAEILLLGVAYKRNVEDTREAPALAIIRMLKQRLARVSYHDPYVPRLRSRHLDEELSSIDLTAESAAGVDAVVIVTDHEKIDYELVVRNAKLVVDTRNVTANCRNPGAAIILA